MSILSLSMPKKILIPSLIKGDKWPGSLDFLASSWAFSLSLHSLWSLPLAVIQNGGLVFILVYIFLSLILGGPLLMLEVFLGKQKLFKGKKIFGFLQFPVLFLSSGLGALKLILPCYSVDVSYLFPSLCNSISWSTFQSITNYVHDQLASPASYEQNH